MPYLVPVAPQQAHQIPYQHLSLYLHHLLAKRIEYSKDKGHSVAKYFNSHTTYYEFSITLECIVYRGVVIGGRGRAAP